MNPQTRYAYEKRIKELEARLRKAECDYLVARSACSNIYDAAISATKTNGYVTTAYLLEQMKRIWRP
jgi:hypothetical protein